MSSSETAKNMLASANQTGNSHVGTQTYMSSSSSSSCSREFNHLNIVFRNVLTGYLDTNDLKEILSLKRREDLDISFPFRSGSDNT